MDFQNVDSDDIGRWAMEAWQTAERTDDQQVMLVNILFARECEAELNRREQ